jgi:hypothetical protein
MADDANVAEQHRSTAEARRRLVIDALSRELNPDVDGSAASRLRALLAEPRQMVISGDVDGFVSAMMLSAVAGWEVVAVVSGSEKVRLHPQYESLEALADAGDTLFGVDVFSTRFPNASNHPVLWGSRRLQNKAEAGQIAQAYDAKIQEVAQEHLFLNPSLWARIEASVGDAKRPTAATYRYPLGTAQILLAALEAAGRGPKLFDRDFLPWLIANCDGGVKTIQAYPFNVPLWWSSMAAAVGPGSISEAIYRLVSEQRVNEFIGVDRIFRYEARDTAATVLDTDWNLPKDAPADAVRVFVTWVSGISGWPDPFQDGVDRYVDWHEVVPARGLYWMTTLSADGGLAEFEQHMTQSLDALHTNFSFFDQNWRLGWLAAGMGDGQRHIGGKRPKKVKDDPDLILDEDDEGTDEPAAEDEGTEGPPPTADEVPMGLGEVGGA